MSIFLESSKRDQFPAADAGINARLFKRHGRWLSENAKDGYVKDNFQSLLFVSKSLGI